MIVCQIQKIHHVQVFYYELPASTLEYFIFCCYFLDSFIRYVDFFFLEKTLNLSPLLKTGST